MESKALEKVCQKIYRQFPPLKNKRPTVKRQGEGRFLLIFSGSEETADGKKISQTIRVVASSEGRILKTSMQR